MSTDNEHKECSLRVKLVGVTAIAGFVSAAFGFAAEITKVQLAEAQVYERGCVYPSHWGTKTLAIFAVVTLFGFRVYCPGIRSPSSSMILLSRRLSWLASFVALIFYIVGLVMIINQGHKVTYQDNLENYYECNVVKPGVFGAGASFALASVVLEVIFMVVTTNHNLEHKTTTTDHPLPEPSVLAMC